MSKEVLTSTLGLFLVYYDWFILNTSNHSHATRANATIGEGGVLVNTDNLFVPYARTTHYGLKSIRVKGPTIWNNVPYNIRSIEFRNTFKKELKKYFVLHYQTILCLHSGFVFLGFFFLPVSLPIRMFDSLEKLKLLILLVT